MALGDGAKAAHRTVMRRAAPGLTILDRDVINIVLCAQPSSRRAGVHTRKARQRTNNIH